MPPRKGYRKRKGKKMFRKKKLVFSLGGKPSGLNALPRVTMLRYCENVKLTTPLGILSSLAYRANGIQDPEVILGGHQPMGFDTWATLYRAYCVIGAKISITPSCDAIASQSNFNTGVYLSENQTPLYVSASEFIEADRGEYLTYTSGQSTARTMTSKYSAKKFFNVNDVKDVQERIGSNITTLPAQQAYFILWLQNLDILNSPVVDFRIVIDYAVLFSEPQNLPQS